MSNFPPITDRSYGMITMRYLPGLPLSTPPPPPTPANTQLLLIQQKTIWESVPPFWCFPKGHAEPGDASTIHTAIRELEEETSLKVKLEDIMRLNSAADTGEIEGQDAKDWDGSFSEIYINPVRKNGKEVRYWLALVGKEEGEKQIKLQEKEVAGYKWCSWEETAELLTYDEAKEKLRRVLARFEDCGKV
ncbi:abe63b89-7c5d-48b1-9d9d-6402a9e889ef-CDS [Sclerotinia trifoliorum]|uniref:Abe63b89-7c5d-48b1-9d9d-6402a9e889ef-CDS n=1 Tax=Sclerotinia trifoliorum TaxID=28548 RepID=A0A8H2ZQ00_9HELO|nr:abe63b89-7c5d-48b1-9d9d-6402a9e889ef-CDS [Sclerotinia trifoliorum]